ncbi:MAG: hypothetical protein HC913_17560 [Microscillaceae bacterium]|nr:hypothetical protein [Microscillaceae bacterium]
MSDSQKEKIMSSANTSSFYAMAWLSFIIATVGMLVGIVYMPLNLELKAFFALGYFYTVSSCFTLAKTIRDKHEAEQFHNRLKDAKYEKFLNEYERIGAGLS